MATNYNTSEYAGLIRGSADRLVEDWAPVDAADTRDGVVNNLNHTEDSACQCVINLSGRVAGKGSWDGVGSGADYSRVELLPPLPVILRVMPDGNTSRLVIRLHGYITSAGTATWRFALMPYGSFSSSPPSAASLGFTNIAELSTTSTSQVELGPASVYASARDGSPYWKSASGLNAAGDLASTSVILAQLEVWALSTSAGLPRMEALTGHEWIA